MRRRINQDLKISRSIVRLTDCITMRELQNFILGAQQLIDLKQP